MCSVHHLANGDITAALRAIPSLVGDTTCASAHYQFLRFPSPVPCIYAPCKRPRTNQRWNNRSSPLGEIRTKDESKNSQTQKSTFIKIAISFPFLIPCPILPREHRPTTERTPHQLPVTQKMLFVKISWKGYSTFRKKWPYRCESGPRWNIRFICGSYSRIFLESSWFLSFASCNCCFNTFTSCWYSSFNESICSW